MLYVSPTLTMMMLAVVPPVSLGAVCSNKISRYSQLNIWQVFYGRYLKRLSNKTQEAMGEMTKVRKPHRHVCCSFGHWSHIAQLANESLTALRTVQSYNAVPQEEKKFHVKIVNVLSLARKEAIASGIFFGSTGWSGNVTLLGLLAYGMSRILWWSEFQAYFPKVELSSHTEISLWETWQVYYSIPFM